MSAEGATAVRRVSWVELYFDLIFVFAMRQAAHTLVDEPSWRGVLTAFVLFVPLWWTWIGFVILYNRSGAEDAVSHRLFVLAGTLPCAVAAIEVHGGSHGDTAGFALALAATRAVLAVAFWFTSDVSGPAGRRLTLGYVLSTVVFALSALVPTPWRYVVWLLMLAQEAGLLLLGRKPRRARTGQEETLRAMLKPPSEATLRIDPAHLAERFGLFMIILFGEIVISVGSAAILVEDRGLAYWIGVLSGFVLAAALWWIYFGSAAEINEHVLRASGGNPAVAYGLYAAGHLGPAFSLLVMAAGVSLALEHDPPGSAGWLIAGGLAVYLVGTQAVVPPLSMRFGRLVRIVAVGATVGLALLQPWITAAGVLLVATIWTVMAAALVTWHHPGRLGEVVADPLAIFRDR